MSAAREHPEFDAAVLALIASVESGEPLSERHLAVLLQGLGRYPDDDTSFDDVLALLAGQDAVLRLMARARDRGEHELNDLIRTFKDLAEDGCTPTQRQLGAALALSHTEIRRRLDRLATLVRDVEETPS